MTAVLIAILTTTVAGIPLALAIGPRRRLATIGLGFLYGTGIVYGAALALSIAGIRWSLFRITIVMLAAMTVVLMASRRPAKTPHATKSLALRLPDLATFLMLAGYAAYATLARVWEWDFWSIWGLKARVFLGAGGIDWEFVTSRWNAFVHPDYPLLLPFNDVYAALASGGWDDRWLGLLSFAFGCAAVLIVRELMAEETTPLVASAITFAASGFLLSGFIGLAEAPLIAFGTTAILFLRRGEWTHAAILLGLAASAKNEGLALSGAVILAALLADRKRFVRLWPAIVIVMPWLLLRASHTLATDIASGPLLDRVLRRMHALVPVVRLLWDALPDKGIWILLLAAFLFAWREWKRERLALAAVAMHTLFLTGAYLATPHDVPWHIATSWPRLSRQLAALAVPLVMLMLARSFRADDDLPHAEARSGQ